MTLVSSWLKSSRTSNGNIAYGAAAPNKTGVGKLQISANKSPYLRNDARQGQCYYEALIGSHICAFDWYQNHRPWMTLNGRYPPYCRKDTSFGAHCKNLNEDRPIHYQRQRQNFTEMRRMTLVRNIRYTLYICGYSLGCQLPRQWGCRRQRQFLAISI